MNEEIQNTMEYLLSLEDSFDKMSFVRKLFLRIFRKRTWNIESEDTHCYIKCECGNYELGFSAGDYKITWCDNCGRGYSTQFKAYKYPRFLK